MLCKYDDQGANHAAEQMIETGCVFSDRFRYLRIPMAYQTGHDEHLAGGPVKATSARGGIDEDVESIGDDFRKVLLALSGFAARCVGVENWRPSENRRSGDKYSKCEG